MPVHGRADRARTDPVPPVIPGRRWAGRVPRRLTLVSIVSSCYLAAGCDAAPEPPPPPVDYAMVCVDPRTHNRVEDELCGEDGQDFTTPPGLHDDTDVIVFAGGRSYGWYYYGADKGLSAPAVGGRVRGGSFTTPKANGVRPPVGLAPKSGGLVQRGGLGVSGGGKGGSAGVKGGGSAGT